MGCEVCGVANGKLIAQGTAFEDFGFASLGETDFVFGVGNQIYNAASVFIVSWVVHEAECLVPLFGFCGAIVDATFAGITGRVIKTQAFKGGDGGGLGLEMGGDE